MIQSDIAWYLAVGFACCCYEMSLDREWSQRMIDREPVAMFMVVCIFVSAWPIVVLACVFTRWFSRS